MSAYSGHQYGDISPRVGVYAVAKFLEKAAPQLILEKFARVEALPKNKSLTIKWRRTIPFDVSPIALTEGVTPAPQAIDMEDVTATIAQYGAWMGFSDVVQDTYEDPILAEAMDNMADQAATTKEMIIWNVMRAGTQVLYSGSATSRATVVAPIDENVLIDAQMELKTNHAKPITKMLTASLKIATEPVAGGYIGVGHTRMERDLRDLTGFVVREKYSESTKLLSEYEIGKFQDLRFILTPHLEPFYGAGDTTLSGVLNNGTRVDVYPLVIFGADAFAVTPLKGAESVNIQVINPKATVEDPLAQRGAISWKMWFVATRLNEQWIIRVESAVTA